jgi:hypothetical protein
MAVLVDEINMIMMMMIIIIIICMTAYMHLLACWNLLRHHACMRHTVSSNFEENFQFCKQQNNGIDT